MTSFVLASVTYARVPSEGLVHWRGAVPGWTCNLQKAKDALAGPSTSLRIKRAVIEFWRVFF